MTVREHRKREILNAAAKIFAENGFEKSKIESIAREAGLGKGTVYEYFRSKDELFEQLLLQIMRDFADDIERTATADLSFPEKLAMLIDNLGLMAQSPFQALFSYAEIPLSCRKLTHSVHVEKQRIDDAILTLARSSIEAGELRETLDPSIAAHIIKGLISQFTISYLFEPQTYSKEKILLAMQAIYDGIGVK